MKSSILVFTILILIVCCKDINSPARQSNCGEEAMPKYDYRATVKGEMTPEIDSILRIEKKRDVFKPCRTLSYNAKFYSNVGNIITNETISVSSTGKRWEHQPEKQDEIAINYFFNKDSIKIINQHQLNKTSVNPNWRSQELTGVIENVEKIWTHPFRSNQYNFTQVAPFPQVELPLRIGKTWTDKNISLKDGFGDWANMKVISTFEVIDKSEITTLYGKFPNSWKIKAVSEFPLGESELTYWFNAEYGFVKMNYINYGGQRLDIEITGIKDMVGGMK